MWRLRPTAHPALTPDEGGALLNERDGQWIELNPRAARALAALVEAGTREGAAVLLAAGTPLTSEQARADVDSLADQLAALGLADERPLTASAPIRRRGIRRRRR